MRRNRSIALEPPEWLVGVLDPVVLPATRDLPVVSPNLKDGFIRLELVRAA